MKKKLSALLCALCMAMALCLTAFAAGTPTFSAAAKREGSKVTLTLSMDSADTALTGVQCDVKYDTSKLEYDAAGNNAEGLYGTTDAVDNDGTITVLAFVGTGAAVTESGHVITLSFNVKEGATGTAEFALENVKVAGEKGKVDANVGANPSVEVADPTPTTAPTTEPTAAPTQEPTAAPTTEPTAAPTTEPTVAPTTAPTAAPTNKPTAAPTSKPTAAPTAKPAATSKPASSDKSTTTATATAAPAATTTTAAIPQTGDNANLALYAVLCVASAIALGVVVYRKKANH